MSNIKNVAEEHFLSENEPTSAGQQTIEQAKVIQELVSSDVSKRVIL